MRRSKTLGPVLAMVSALFIGGCAGLLPPQAARCGETPERVVRLFLEGVARFDLAQIRKTVPVGWHPLDVFGGRDREAGRTAARQFFQHPDEVPPHGSVGMAPALVAMTHLGGNGWYVNIEREDLVTADGKDDEVKVYRRAFLAQFDPQENCITSVRALDPAWQRIR